MSHTAGGGRIITGEDSEDDEEEDYVQPVLKKPPVLNSTSSGHVITGEDEESDEDDELEDIAPNPAQAQDLGILGDTKIMVESVPLDELDIAVRARNAKLHDTVAKIQRDKLLDFKNRINKASKTLEKSLQSVQETSYQVRRAHQSWESLESLLLEADTRFPLQL